MCIQLLLVSVLLLAFVSPFSSSREFSGFTPHQDRKKKKNWSDCLGQVNFAPAQVKIEVQRPGGQVKLHVASVVFCLHATIRLKPWIIIWNPRILCS